MDPQKRNNWI